MAKVQKSMDEPSSLQDAINIIKFMTTTHKQEIAKLKQINQKQADMIKKLEATRKKELEYLSNELHKYEMNLSLRTETVTRQLAEKDEIIQKQTQIIEDLQKQLEEIKQRNEESTVPQITISVDSNSDSGIAMENEEVSKETELLKPEVKIRRCRRLAESISFLRRVDFSPMKYKPCSRQDSKVIKKDNRNNLDVIDSPTKRVSVNLHSDDERSLRSSGVFSDTSEDVSMVIRKNMNDSMNNHFSDDGSDGSSEEVFDRVMNRSSMRRSVKVNPKYKKINRTKSKLLEHVKNNLE